MPTACSALCGGSFFPAEVAVAEIPPLTLVLLRVGIAATELVGERLGRQALRRTSSARTAPVVLGLLNKVVPSRVQTRIGPGLASMLNATIPLRTVLLAHPLTQDERLSAGRLARVVVGILGVAMMPGGGVQADRGAPILAEIARLAAALSNDCAGICERRLETARLAPVALAASRHTCSTLRLLPSPAAAAAVRLGCRSTAERQPPSHETSRPPQPAATRRKPDRVGDAGPRAGAVIGAPQRRSTMATRLKDDLDERMDGLGRAARDAAAVLAQAPRETKDRALLVAAAELRARTATIAAANAKDVAAAEARGLSPALLDRLRLDAGRIAAMATGLEVVAALDDPVGRELARWTRPNGLDIARVAVPLGVIGIIFESRPNVAADAGALCLKSGNAVILRGGSESFHSVAAILDALRHGLVAAGLPEAAIQAVPTTDRAAVGAMLRMTRWIDVIVPRGGRSLIERVEAESRVPILAHLDGICHVYLHESADPALAVAITLNAKMRRTGVCGAAETLLVDRAAAARLLPPVLDALALAGCELRGDATVRALDARVLPATEEDWRTEYLDAILAIRTVDGLEEAIAHINAFGSHHTDSIVATDRAAAERFLAAVDSAIVLHDASTQFADGGEFGFGAEIGISTGRLHARGPVGVEQLTSYKYVIRGTGQIRPI